MFSYYGSKSKIINKYPIPINNIIIEPFAGSAKYAYKYWEKDVILCDKYNDIILVWKYLQLVSPKDILGLPNIMYKEDVRNYKHLSWEERLLIGFCINRGRASIRNIGQKFNSWNTDKIKIANNLYKIKHWKIILGDYHSLFSGTKATWFIDPPYQFGGNRYKRNNKFINYIELSEWCKKLNGQVIVCENNNASWMNFIPLAKLTGQRHTTTEVMWYKE